MTGKQAFSFYNRITGQSVRLVLKPKPLNMTPEESRKLLGNNLSFAAAEAYKLLRTNLNFSIPGGKTGCKIIPMAITGTSEIFEDHLPWIRKKEVTLVYGEPVIISELSKEDQKAVGAYCQKKVKELMS